MGTATIEVDPSEVQSISVDPSEVSAMETQTQTAPAKPGFWERAYETSGAKGLIDLAKQRDQELRDMYGRVGDHLQNGDMGGAISEFTQHAGKVLGQTITDLPPVAIARSQYSQVPKAIAAAKAGDFSTAAGRGLAAITPLLGPAAADTGEKIGADVGEGNWKGAAGDVSGFAGPLLAAKGIEALAPEISTSKMTAPVRAAVRGANKVLAKAPATVGAGAGASIGGYFGGSLGAEIGAGAGALAGKELLPQVKIPGEGFGLPSRVAGGPATAPEFLAQPPAQALAADPGVMHGPNPAPAQLPEGFTTRAPYPEPVGTANNPFRAPNTPTEPANASPAASAAQETAPELEGQASPQTENAGAAPSEATPAQTPEQILNKKGTPAELKQLLETALGGKGLKKGVSLKNQNAPTPAPPDPSLPKDFTPVDSTALKGYKYSPETREFESITQGGQHYIHGDVSPEDNAAFEAADSKGKAWQKIRDNPLVAKVVNGQRMAVIKGKSLLDMPPADALSQKLANLQDFIPSQKPAAATPANVQPAAAPSAANPDLTTDWSKALADIQAKQPANAPAARIASGVIKSGAESDVAAAPGTAAMDTESVAKVANAERIRKATEIIKDPATSYEDKLVAYKNLQDATVGPPNVAEISARAQAGMTRNMAEPRTEVETPSASRKKFDMKDEDFLNARKNQRKKSGG